MTKVIRTTSDKEQAEKDEAFLRLKPLEQWEHALRVKNEDAETGG